MQRYAETKLTIMPINSSPISIWIGLINSCHPKYKPASVIIGIDKRNENVAAVLRSKPSNNAIVMVIPERDVPGIKATDCAKPIFSASLMLISFVSLDKVDLRSAYHSSNPKIIVVIDITRVERALLS